MGDARVADPSDAESRVTLTVTAGRADGRRIGEYVLDHTAA